MSSGDGEQPGRALSTLDFSDPGRARQEAVSRTVSPGSTELCTSTAPFRSRLVSRRTRDPDPDIAVVAGRAQPPAPPLNSVRLTTVVCARRLGVNGLAHTSRGFPLFEHSFARPVRPPVANGRREWKLLKTACP